MGRPVFLFLLLIAACRSGGKETEAVSTDRVVLNETPTESEGDPKRSDEWFSKELEIAEAERQNGHLRAAIERVYAAREEAPGAARLREFNALLQRLNREVLELDTLDAWVEAEKDPVTFGDALRIRIHLKNRSKLTIRIPARVEGASNSVFRLTVTRRSYDVRANVSVRMMVIRQEILHDLEIPPGGSASRLLILEAASVGNDVGLDGFRIFAVGGRLRPAVIELGGLRRWEAIRIKTGDLRSFRPNWEHLAKKPLKMVGMALEKQAGVHLLTAAALLPPKQRAPAVDRMVANLRGDRRIDWATFAALQHLTNLKMGRDASAWRAWWPRVRDTYFLTPARKPTDKPAFD